MTVDSPGFHAHSNWYFRREDDGSVRIVAPDSAGPGAQQVVILDASTWASVVASVSAGGETAESYTAALAFHQAPAVDPFERARAAYSCYGKVVGWHTYRGDPMPAWDELAEVTQHAWIAAAAAAASFRPAATPDPEGGTAGT